MIDSTFDDAAAPNVARPIILTSDEALFRFTERRILAEFARFDWIAAVAAGAIVGRAATAADTAWLQAITALVCLLAAHAVLARLRLIPALCRFIDPPLMVLISDGEVNRRNLRRCGLTAADLEAVLREHGHPTPTVFIWPSSKPKGRSPFWVPTWQ